MSVERAIALAVSATSLFACCGAPDPVPFDVEASFGPDQLRELEDVGFDPSSCESLCRSLLEEPDVNDEPVADIEFCELTASQSRAEAIIPDFVGRSEVERRYYRSPIDVQCSGLYRYYCEGRRPAGRVAARRTTGSLVAVALSDAAVLESVSVTAFKEIAGRLHEENAPRALVARCQRAAREEAQHARALGMLARRLGAAGGRFVEVGTQNPSLNELAIHNAVEGCVLENWAAVRCAWRARYAPTYLRQVYRRIADDESRHAQLAWDLDKWFRSRVDRPTREAMAERQARALRSLPTLAAASGPSPLGDPSGRLAVTLARRFILELQRTGGVNVA